MTHLAIYQQYKGAWFGSVPDMPGLLVSGTTRRSAERKLRDGIALYLEELALKGNPAPARNTLDAAVHLIDV